MSALATAGQSLSLVVGGVGLGLALAFGGILWFERDRAADLTGALLSERLDHLNTAAELGTCLATRDALREGREIDAEIPLDLDGFDPRPEWLRPDPRPD